ncbi:MAG: OB-fold nucleic acid binding domain-containing protein [Candidatus Nezhaarchaeales archaeon]|nr:MAG: DNA-binding protein [Candidatus Nezhaarchaeota archaeon WYZ-LMO8]TDA36007.1 MAG: DNA-binding protein [Candidatus Nezhaarchaeota archaeon WYZ-LMO7]
MRKVQISEIEGEMRDLVVEGVVVEKSKPKTVQTRYGPAQLAYAIIDDGTGQIKLNLWRNQIDLVNVGAKIRVENAFTREFRGEVELNVGSNGKIVVLEKGK